MGVNKKKASIIILTLNAGKTIKNLLSKIDTKKFEVIIIDSSSSDNTLEHCKEYACNTITINKEDFNHGATREMGRKLCNTEIIVHMTQDAIPVNENTIDELIKPIIEGKASVSYARQIPRDGAKILEAFPRSFNYGIEEQIRSIIDVDKYGVYTFFCSDSCAAWSNSALDEIGGFKTTLTNEDYIACAELLFHGYKIAYVSDAIVVHSHQYSLIQEFQRMFDTGYVRAERPWIQRAVGTSIKRGASYFITLIKELFIISPFLIPYAFLQTCIKYLGYQTGFHALNFPKCLKKALSDQKYYWDSKYYNG